MEFTARKSIKDHPSKMKAADESMRVTEKKVCVFVMVRKKNILKKQESSWKVSGKLKLLSKEYKSEVTSSRQKSEKILRIPIRMQEKYYSSWIEMSVHSCCGK